MTINADQNKFVVSIYDADYDTAPDPLPAATLDPIAADGNPDTAIDIQGVIGVLGSDDVLTATLPYTATSAVNYAAFSQTVSVPSTLIEGGGDPIALTLSYPAGTTVVGNGTITATIVAASTINVKQLDLYGGGLYETVPGYPLAVFTVPTDDSGATENLGVRISSGIPDREFGDVAHNFLYLPVTNPTTGKTWLNHNLGAHYTQVNHPDFDPSHEITDLNDHLAFGSLYQGGRYSDGHELTTWTGPENATSVNSGVTTAKLPSTNRDSSAFIYTCNFGACYPYSWMDPINFDTWNGVDAANNPCPDGYRLPTEEEYTIEVASWSSIDVSGVLASTLKLTTAGRREGGSHLAAISSSTRGYYATSEYRGFTVDDEYRTALLYFNPSSGSTSISQDYTRNGFPVRCIKD